MPHFTIEYSANLDGAVDLGAFCEQIRRSALATGVFETGAIRVRAIRCEHYAIADADPANGFIDVSLRIGAGRSEAVQRQLGDSIFAAMSAFLDPLFAVGHFALSFEVRQIDAALSYKRNSIHERLRPPAPCP